MPLAGTITTLCLEAIEELSDERGGRLGSIRVADLGCGSGIWDRRPAGRRQQRGGRRYGFPGGPGHPRQRRSQRLQEQFQVDLGSVERLAELLEGRPADLLLCNILAPVIEALCPAFDTVLAPGGLGFLSGLLVSQAPRLQEALAEQGWSAELTAQQSQWGLMTIRRS